MTGAARRDHRRGFSAYEAALRGYGDRNRRLALAAVEQRRPPEPEAVQEAAAVDLRSDPLPEPRRDEHAPAAAGLA